MNHPDTDPPRFPGPRHFGLAAVAYTLFVAYGSFVPLEFKAISLHDALDQFRHVPYYHLGVYKRQDLVANLLLYLPVGFFWAGAVSDFCRWGFRGFIAAVAAVVAISLIQATTVVGIEFAQLWFPRRTVSMNDMLAEAAGCGLGMVAWFVLRNKVPPWIERLVSRTTGDADLFVLLLYTYLGGLVLYQLIPFDLVLTPEEIRRKIIDGRVILNPFASPSGDFFYSVWQVVADMLLFIPVGVLGRIGGVPDGQIRPARRATIFVLVLAVAVEVSQIFIFSRYAASQDVITSTLGGVIGIRLGGPLWALRGDPDRRERLLHGSQRPGLLLSLAAAYTALLLAYFWYPFDINADWSSFEHRLRGFFDVPFSKYYVGTEQSAAANLMRAMVLFVPVGALARWALGDRLHSRAARWLLIILAACLLGTLIETGQAAMRSRYCDITDVLVYTLGAALGAALASKLHSRLSAQRPSPGSTLRNRPGSSPTPRPEHFGN